MLLWRCFIARASLASDCHDYSDIHFRYFRFDYAFRVKFLLLDVIVMICSLSRKHEEKSMTLDRKGNYEMTSLNENNFTPRCFNLGEGIKLEVNQDPQ